MNLALDHQTLSSRFFFSQMIRTYMKNFLKLSASMRIHWLTPILSSCTVPTAVPSNIPADQSQNITAPKLDNNRYKIIWTEESIEAYESLVSTHLSIIREQWLVLLETTNMILSQAALLLNKSVDLSTKANPKSNKIPSSV
jgi:hypothetical protein